MNYSRLQRLYSLVEQLQRCFFLRERQLLEVKGTPQEQINLATKFSENIRSGMILSGNTLSEIVYTWRRRIE